MKKWLTAVAAAALMATAPLYAEPLSDADMAKVNQLVDKAMAHRPTEVGYPVNQDIRLKNFYEWYLSRNAYRYQFNNAGSPDFSANPKQTQVGFVNTHELERDIIFFMAPRYGFKTDNVWGIVTMSGTDGNSHGIYFGTNYLKAKTGKRPVLYVSEEAHYSIRRLCDLQNIDLKLIKADKMGAMIPAEFEKALDPKRPALVVIAMGTTFKGGIDDQKAIDKILKRKKPIAVYRHMDAALFGGILSFSKDRNLIDRTVTPYDSVAVSGHKYFGIDEPSGFFMTTKDVYDNQKSFNIGYLNGNMPMINCSRSGLAALKLWWIMKQAGEKGFEEQTAFIFKQTDRLANELKKIGYPYWVNGKSNTIFFKRPQQWMVQKWHLANEYDKRFGGDLSHIVVMQHVDDDTIDRFIADIKKSRAEQEAAAKK